MRQFKRKFKCRGEFRSFGHALVWNLIDTLIPYIRSNFWMFEDDEWRFDRLELCFEGLQLDTKVITACLYSDENSMKKINKDLEELYSTL